MADMTLDEAVKWLRDHVGDLRSAARVLRESPWGAKLAATAAAVDKAADEGALAAAALEAAREDAERLDWLASEAQPLWGSRDRGGHELPYFDITSGRECCDPGDLRAAIDRARRKENGDG